MFQRAKENHYVAKWYQKRFLADGETHFYLLDLSPPTKVSPRGDSYQLHAVRRLGPPSCFVQDDLYTLKLGKWSTDTIERAFFGPIDHRGKKAVEFFAEYDVRYARARRCGR